jgi:CRP-like cAMP-binding protein
MPVCDVAEIATSRRRPSGRCALRRPRSFTPIVADNLADWIRAKGVRRAVPPGETLAHRGARADSVLLVEQGRLFLERYESNGNLLPISVCARGAVVGLGAAILDRPHDLNTTSRVGAEVIAVTASSMRELTTCPEHAPLIARALAAETRVLADRCAALQSQTVRDRVLTILSELSQESGAFPIDLALPMQELAVMVGADLTHVCRVMRSLRADGVVDYGKRRLAIRSPIAVARAHDLPS